MNRFKRQQSSSKTSKPSASTSQANKGKGKEALKISSPKLQKSSLGFEALEISSPQLQQSSLGFEEQSPPQSSKGKEKEITHEMIAESFAKLRDMKKEPTVGPGQPGPSGGETLDKFTSKELLQRLSIPISLEVRSSSSSGASVLANLEKEVEILQQAFMDRHAKREINYSDFVNMTKE
ncbi:MAG: hypothetical protein LQ350_003291 [Teloschistes chrysophthalmus]|nr:MAG: hypothetical protein LQ350_003291 [Niorma chrysophthalma]